MQGGAIIVEADELLSRVLQHEIDHLNGIEYVQRLHGEELKRVYSMMRESGVDLELLPPIPYI